MKENRFLLNDFNEQDVVEILNDNNVTFSLSAKRAKLLALLLYVNGIEKKNDKGEFFVENSFLCEHVGISERALITALRKFENDGIISRNSGKRGNASTYIINIEVLNNFSNNFSKNFSNNVLDYQTVTTNFSNNFSDNFSHNFSTDIDIDIESEIEKDKEIDKEKNNIKNKFNINLIKKENIKEKNEISIDGLISRKIEEKIEEKLKNKINSIIEEKLENIIENKFEKIQENLENKLNSIIEKNIDKIFNKIQEKINLKIEEKFENKFDSFFNNLKEKINDNSNAIPLTSDAIELSDNTKSNSMVIPTTEGVVCSFSPIEVNKSSLTDDNVSDGTIIPPTENNTTERKEIPLKAIPTAEVGVEEKKIEENPTKNGKRIIKVEDLTDDELEEIVLDSIYNDENGTSPLSSGKKYIEFPIEWKNEEDEREIDTIMPIEAQLATVEARNNDESNEDDISSLTDDNVSTDTIIPPTENNATESKEIPLKAIPTAEVTTEEKKNKEDYQKMEKQIIINGDWSNGIAQFKTHDEMGIICGEINQLTKIMKWKWGRFIFNFDELTVQDSEFDKKKLNEKHQLVFKCI